MNKLITLFFCAVTFLSYGQTNLFDIGIEGGLGAASLRDNDLTYDHHHNRIGYETGIFGQYNFKQLISIRTGVYYEKKGSSTRIPIFFDPGTSIDTIKGKESFDYITVPLLIKVTFGKKINYFVNAGPYISFLLKQTEQYDQFDPIRQSSVTTLDRTSGFKRTEMGLSSGLGILFNCKQKFTFSLEARDNLGLTKTTKEPIFSNGVTKTNSANLLLGISYKLGHRNNLKRK
jgi:hypothetical protein